MIEPVEVQIVLNAAPEKVFRAFTADINAWWPVKTHSICAGTVLMEPHSDGKIIETGEDGKAHIWGHVTLWNPPHELAIEWYVGRTVKEATQIHVRFDATDDGRTGITLVHSGWEVLGESAAETREGYKMGWSAMLTHNFAPFCEA